MRCDKRSGFTLLEVIIVIIIVGVLASLALPRFFATVEFSRSTEALTSIGALRQSVERCFTAQDGDYLDCTIGAIDLEDPANSPGNHFSYLITPAGTTGFTIRATRNTLDGGNVGDQVNLEFNGTAFSRSGSGAFVGIK